MDLLQGDRQRAELAFAVSDGMIGRASELFADRQFEDMCEVALSLVCEMYQKHELENPFIVVDANHANSKKIYSEQPRIIAEILHNRTLNKDLNKMVRGVMVESYIEEGSQKVGEHVYGKSITDACIGWDTTEKLLHYIAEHV